MLQDWKVSEVDGRIHVGHLSQSAVGVVSPVLLLKDGKPDGPIRWRASANAGHWTFDSDEGIQLRMALEELDCGALRLLTTLRNLSSQPVALKSISLLSLDLGRGFTRVLGNGREMNSHTDLLVAGKQGFESSIVAGFTNEEGSKAVVVGWEEPGESFCWITVAGGGGGSPAASAWCDREETSLPSGGELRLSPLLVYVKSSLWGAMRSYARVSGKACGARAGAPTMSGWCSWYSYYGTETVEDILKNARTLAKSSIGPWVKVIQIDDGWNLPEPEAPRNWGDWQAGAKFPQGMKWIADQIKKEGFQAGLWLAPFSVDPASVFFQDKRDLLIQDESGEPKPFWGVYGLDLTNPKAIDFVQETFERVFNEWGYDYIKIDFLLHAIQPGRRHNPSMTTAAALRRGLEAIREVAGDRFVLGCGCPMGPALGIVDAMRIGPDVSHRWYLPMNLNEWPSGNCSIYSGSVYTFWRHWMHGAWWQNDPDCILVHDDGTVGERHEFQKIDGGAFSTDPPMGMSDEEAGFWVRMVWMTGGMAMVGESLDNLTPQRRELLAKSFPLNDRPTRWVDHYHDPRVVALRTEGGAPMVAVFNLTDRDRRVLLPASSLGLDGGKRQFIERISGEKFTSKGDVIEFPELPAHGGRIWESV